jgi:hypothetical protein
VGLGVLYVAYGQNAGKEARLSIDSLRNYHPRWKVRVIGDARIEGTEHKEWLSGGKPGRWAKVNLDKLSPWEDTLFLDADTRVYGNLEIGFRLLANGWDFVMCPSFLQSGNALDNCSEEERAQTLYEIPTEPYQLNTGVMWFRKTTRVKRFFAEWRKEWKRWMDVDQGAFLRALNRRPMAIFVLGRPYNGGSVVGHRFGMASG